MLRASGDALRMVAKDIQKMISSSEGKWTKLCQFERRKGISNDFTSYHTPEPTHLPLVRVLLGKDHELEQDSMIDDRTTVRIHLDGRRN